MGSSSTRSCEFQYDYTHPDVVSGKVESGSFCEEIAYKGKRYCKAHCLELGLLSAAETQKEEKRIARERVKPAPPAPDPFLDRILALFGLVNFNAESAYRGVKAMRVAPPGEDTLEMYVFASWLSSDPDTRFPQLEEDLAKILGVDMKVLEEWKEIPEVFDARNKVLTKLALLERPGIWLSCCGDWGVRIIRFVPGRLMFLGKNSFAWTTPKRRRRKTLWGFRHTWFRCWKTS